MAARSYTRPRSSRCTLAPHPFSGTQFAHLPPLMMTGYLVHVLDL